MAQWCQWWCAYVTLGYFPIFPGTVVCASNFSSGMTIVRISLFCSLKTEILTMFLQFSVSITTQFGSNKRFKDFLPRFDSHP